MTRKNLGHQTVDVWAEGSQQFGQNRTDGNLYFEGRNLYSYGRHFKLGYRGDGYFVLNSDGSTVTTTRHQSDVRATMRGRMHIELPFQALYGAGISVDQVRIVDVEPDRVWTTEHRRKVMVSNEGHVYAGGGSWDATWNGEWEDYEVQHHMMGRSVFRVGRRWYLSGLDETARNEREGYFLAQLPKAAKSVAHATELLKPPEAILRESWKPEGVKRQGEWFFIEDHLVKTRDLTPVPTTVMRTGWQRPGAYIAEIEATFIPHRDRDRQTRHYPTELRRLGKDLYARGTVRHLNLDHKMLTLGKVWHLVKENREVISYSGFGGVD